MNTESKFGLKDSLATAVILATMLVFILGAVFSGAEAQLVQARAALDMQKLPPIIASASRVSALQTQTMAVTAPRLAPAVAAGARPNARL